MASDKKFIVENVQRLKRFLHGRGIEYTLNQARRTTSVYLSFEISGSSFRIRIADHRPKFKSWDYSIHPGSRDSVQDVRQLVARRMKSKRTHRHKGIRKIS